MKTPPIPANFRVLILEDEYFLAKELKDTLRDLGVSKVELTGSIHTASTLLEASHFDLGLLDVKIHDEMCYPIADLMTSKKIPFVFITGLEPNLMPSRFFTAEVFLKPCTDAEIRLGLNALISRTVTG